MFQEGHGRKHFKVIKTDRGYYAAFVAGLDEFESDADKARLFNSEAIAVSYYHRSLRRGKSLNRDLPTEFTIEAHKREIGIDQNR